MSLINLTSIQNGDSANDTLFNSRYSLVVNEINGNLDADNLKDSAVTTPKLANTSVTPVKMNLSKTVDANGWTIYDYGTWKEYHKRVTFTFNYGAGAVANLVLSSNNLPVGMATIGNHHLTASGYLNGNAYAMAGTLK